MKSLQTTSSSSSKPHPVQVDDDIYEIYKHNEIRYVPTRSGLSDHLVVIFDEKTRKWQSLPRLILGVYERSSCVEYKDGNPNNLCRENLAVMSRSDVIRLRSPKEDGRMFKGTIYSNGKWYAILTLPNRQRFSRPCQTEVEAAMVYDALLDHLGMIGYRNFRNIRGTLLTRNDLHNLETKLQVRKEA